MPTRSTHLLALTLTAALTLTGLSPLPPSSPPTTTPPTLTDATPRDYDALHNVVAYHDNLYSGSAPEGPPGFSALAALGIKTIISVDGAEPDLARARAHSLRYIHLPIGYNGFDEARKLELVRATRDALAQGPVYIHCHHGKHRSAAAAAAVVASLGWATPDQMLARMKVSGTAPTYTGLFACVSSAKPLALAAIDAVPADFPEISPPPTFLKAMLELDDIDSHLILIQKAGWTTPPDHPDLIPLAEAARMADLFRQLERELPPKPRPPHPPGFTDLLATSARHAQTLEDQLSQSPPPAPATLTAQLKLLAASCKDCHVKHRD